MAKVFRLFRTPKKRLPMEELDTVRVIKNSGLEGCAHARPGGKRQVLLVDRETLEAMDLAPGVIRENITTDGMNVNGLALGQELKIGETRLQVSAICTPCDQLEKIRPGLRREMRGRRGMLCRVLEGGTIQRGDTIEKIVTPRNELQFVGSNGKSLRSTSEEIDDLRNSSEE
ncbi:MAG: MOSC domain-containing protein [Acidobacteriota bacterium]|nr:MOSC domain-containing protein [Acidobacteriota bacterium]